MTRPVRRGLLLGAAAALLVSVVAAAATAFAVDPWTRSRPVPSPQGSLGAGFAPSQSAAPESTFTPVASSWTHLQPGPGYRVVLLTTGEDQPTQTLRTAVHQWATEVGVELRTIVADDKIIESANEAIALRPDLIVIVGEDLIDPMALVSATHLDQQFLVVGAELAEPTQNVTAADWTGASFRGEGLGSSSTYNPASFTSQRCADAVRAGVAAVLSGHTGLVVWLDE